MTHFFCFEFTQYFGLNRPPRSPWFPRGIIVCIPGDEHKGVQSKRPGIVIKTHSEYITVQLLSTTSNQHDIGKVIINNKTQFIRLIYLKNVTFNQIIGFWFDFNTRKNVEINENSKSMNLIESNPYKATAITLTLDEFLQLNNDIKNLNHYKNIAQELLDLNKSLQQENDILKFKLKELETKISQQTKIKKDK